MVSLAARARPVDVASPIVKWVGGKSKLMPQLLSRAPGSYGRYFEPFAGGAALFFRLKPRAAELSDTNAELIACYRAVRDDVEAVMRALRRHRSRHCEDYYYQVRDGWNEGGDESTAERAATFLYLNKTCYNGLWRVNSKGAFNVPAGRYVNPTILDEENLRAASRALAGQGLEACSFENVLRSARRGDFVYFDPPYVPVSETAHFTSYTAEKFGAEDQRRLSEVYRELADRGCAVMLSNSDTSFVRGLYQGFKVDRVWCPRAINSKADSRGLVAEVIVTNRY